MHVGITYGGGEDGFPLETRGNDKRIRGVTQIRMGSPGNGKFPEKLSI